METKQPVRWWPLVLIGVVAGLLTYLVQGLAWGRPAKDLFYIWGGLILAVYLWVRVWSRLSPVFQSLVLIAFLAFQGLMFLACRIDGFAGDGRLIVRWRWTPTADQRWLQCEPKWSKKSDEIGQPASTPFDSPAFRGADRSGVISNSMIDWNLDNIDSKVLWRRPIGLGWSSFAVVGNYCVTQEQRGNIESVVCYDLRTGNEIWQHGDANRFDEITSGPGPRATPAIDQGRVYSLGPSGRLNCLELVSGKLIWSTPLTADERTPLFGFSASPLVIDDLVYIALGRFGSLVAVETESGNVRWRNGLRTPGYSSPQLLEIPEFKEKHILVFDGEGLQGHSADTGKTIWSFPWGDNSEDRVNVAQPLVLNREIDSAKGTDGAQGQQISLIISSGYGRGSARLNLKRETDNSWKVQEVWRSAGLKSKFSSVVQYQGFIYGLDEGILTCLSLADGQRQWKKGRFGYGQLVLVNDVLVIQAESGGIHVVAADPVEFRQIAEFTALNERSWNHPVVVGNLLLLRNDRETMCIELGTFKFKDKQTSQ